MVVGRSNIVGKPLVQLLLNENATVTVAHSKTRDLPAVCRRADLLFAAVGRPEMVRGDWIKPGATVIDVGINRITGADGKNRIVGDVAYARSRGDRGRDHAGAGRRRADDDRVPAGEHRARGLRDPRVAGARRLNRRSRAPTNTGGDGREGVRMFRNRRRADRARARDRAGRRPDGRIAVHQASTPKTVQAHRRARRSRITAPGCCPGYERSARAALAPATSACTSPTATGRRTTSRCRRPFRLQQRL